MRWVVFFSLVLLQILFTAPDYIKTCKSENPIEANLNYLTHHVLDVFLFWSILFLTTRLEFLVHIITVIGVMLHWITNNNTCILTVWMNRLCGYPEGQWLDSLKNKLGLRQLSEYFHFYWLFILVSYDIFMIYRNG